MSLRHSTYFAGKFIELSCFILLTAELDTGRQIRPAGRIGSGRFGKPRPAGLLTMCLLFGAYHIYKVIKNAIAISMLDLIPIKVIVHYAVTLQGLQHM